MIDLYEEEMIGQDISSQVPSIWSIDILAHCTITSWSSRDFHLQNNEPYHISNPKYRQVYQKLWSHTTTCYNLFASISFSLVSLMRWGWSLTLSSIGWKTKRKTSHTGTCTVICSVSVAHSGQMSQNANTVRWLFVSLCTCPVCTLKCNRYSKIIINIL